jgi:hypothetical protein
LNRIRDAFDSVKADEALKNGAAAFVAREAARRQRRPVFRLRYAAATALLLVAILGFGYSAYAMPASYISIDVNPSVELAVNRFDRVVSVKAYNDDGARILADIDVRGKTYTDAVEALLANAEFQTYLNADAMLTFTVVSDRQAEIIAGIEGCEGYARYGAQCRAASSDIVGQARANGLSLGKFQMYLDLAAYDPSITPEQCRFMTMKQLHERLQQCTGGQCEGEAGRGGCPADESGSSSGSGSGSQNGQDTSQSGAQGNGHSGEGQQGSSGQQESPGQYGEPGGGKQSGH